MTVTTKELINSKYVELSVAEQFTASGVTIIDKITVTNTTSSTSLFSLNLTTVNENASTSNLIIDSHPIRPRESYTCPEVVGHVLDDGSKIYAKSSVASSLVLRASGRVIT